MVHKLPLLSFCIFPSTVDNQRNTYMLAIEIDVVYKITIAELPDNVEYRKTADQYHNCQPHFLGFGGLGFGPSGPLFLLISHLFLFDNRGASGLVLNTAPSVFKKLLCFWSISSK